MVRPIHILLLMGLISFSNNAASQNKEKDFERTVYTIIGAFQKQDEKAVNSFINKDLKIASIFRIGVANNFIFLDSLNISSNCHLNGYRPYTAPKTKYKIRYGKLPEFDCDIERWNKPAGLYCDKEGTDSLFTETIRHFMTYEMEYEYVPDNAKISEEKFSFYKDIEKNSRRVVLYDNDGEDIIFYLTWFKNKWYLTIVDRVSSDCSA